MIGRVKHSDYMLINQSKGSYKAPTVCDWPTFAGFCGDMHSRNAVALPLPRAFVRVM